MTEDQMRISKAPNATPKSTPPSAAGRRGGKDPQAGVEDYIWSSLVPRLVHPTKLAIVKVLLGAARPLSVDDLLPLLPAMNGNRELIRHHAMSMVDAGCLEVVSTDVKATGEISYFFFPRPE